MEKKPKDEFSWVIHGKKVVPLTVVMAIVSALMATLAPDLVPTIIAAAPNLMEAYPELVTDENIAYLVAALLTLATAWVKSARDRAKFEKK